MLILVGIATLAVMAAAPRGNAQVSVDMRALDSLGPAREQPRAVPSRPAAPSPSTTAAASRPLGTTSAQQPMAAPPRANTAAPPQAGAAAQTRLDANATPPRDGTPALQHDAAAAPSHSAISPGVEPVHAAPGGAVTAVVTPAAPAPATPVPALPVQQPSRPPAETTAPAPASASTPLPPPVRLLFEAGKADLPPDAAAAIRDLARAMPAPSAESISVLAYASGTPDDPSTARRLSLSRGMAVRSVLLDSGVPSARIYVRALGSTVQDGPADRVELTITPIGTVTR